MLVLILEREERGAGGERERGVDWLSPAGAPTVG